jgi:glycosyltransferase involved in cell wall biosynthesis
VNVSSISVLICTYNRAPLLRETLAAIHAMDAPDCCSVEIVIVDNNSTDDTVRAVAESADGARFPMVLIQESRQGKSFALNAGLAAASGDVLALTDDDVLPAAGWLCRIVEAFRAEDVTFVFGKVLPRWTSTPPPEMLTPPARDIWGPLALVDYGDAPAHYTSGDTKQRLPIGANLAFARHVLLSIGGWRTDLGKVNNTLISGEDHEVFLRLRRHGSYAGYYDPGLTVRHLVPAERLTRQYFRRWFFWHGKTVALMLPDLYPELDMSSVPRIAGAPRFSYRQGLRQLVRWAATRRGDALTALIEELRLVQHAGLLLECWRRRKQVARPLATALVVAAFLYRGAGAQAGPLRLQLAFNDGRLSLVASGVTVQQVLQEWTRVGHTQVDHMEAAPAGVLDIELKDVSEEEALDVLLRQTGGFIARAAPAPSPTASHLDRILIVRGAGASDTFLTASVQNRTTIVPPPMQAGTVQRVIGADGLPVPDDQDAPSPRPTP